ncbi:MAG: hypothetical protein ABSH03_02540 [Candidatus Lustribacter sp.]|jgi:TolB-like protein
MLHRLRLTQLIVALLCVTFAVTLIGASPSPSPLGPSSLGPSPTIMIFPMRQPEGLDPKAGIAYSLRLATALTALGGVKVVPGDPATAASDYLHVAKAAGADFYMMGSVAPPINNAVAVVQQVVSTRTGIVSWSGTAYVTTGDDVAAQAPLIKTALVTYETRGYMAILNPTPVPVQTAAPTPVPKSKRVSINEGAGGSGPTSADQAPLPLPNEAYGFSSKPTAPPKVYASAAKPSRFVVLTFVGKNVTPQVRDYTVDSLIKALKKHGQSAAEGNPDTTNHRLPSADLCSSTGAAYLVFGSVSGASTKGNDFSNYVPHSNASIAVAAYDCATQSFVQTAKEVRGAGARWTDAIDHAANAAVTDYLLKVAAVARSS